MAKFAFVSGTPVVRGSTLIAPCISAVGVQRRAFARVPTYRRAVSASVTQKPEPHSTSDGMGNKVESNSAFETLVMTMTAAMMGFSVNGLSAAEAVPEGLKEAFKSIPASLAHPVVMWIAVATTLYTFYLGYQSSRIRSASPEERKELVKGKYGERHFKIASALFATVTLATFGGMANTYTRAGKLFPGPHLYAGLGIIATMSVMTSMVPYMQKGQDWAKKIHFSGAFVVTSFFLWQAKSGMVIVGKLLNW